MLFPDAADGSRAKTGSVSQTTRAPLGRVLRLLVKRFFNDLSHLGFVYTLLTPRSGAVTKQTCHASQLVTDAPSRDSRRRGTQLLHNLASWNAVLHAITDAILGALGAGDIGEAFPDTDARWRSADSAVFVQHARALAERAKMRIANCDVTIITEEPKLKAHKPAMKRRVAELLGIAEERVSIKAKTNEGMGWIGKGDGLAAIAVVLLE